jgi:hypothetical protein
MKRLAVTVVLMVSLLGCVTVPDGWNDSVAADVTAVSEAAACLWTTIAPTDTQKCLRQAADTGAITYLTARKVDAKGKVASKNACLKIAVKAMQEAAEFSYPAVLKTGSGRLENVVRLELKVDANDADQVLGLCLAGINAK